MDRFHVRDESYITQYNIALYYVITTLCSVGMVTHALSDHHPRPDTASTPCPRVHLLITLFRGSLCPWLSPPVLRNFCRRLWLRWGAHCLSSPGMWYPRIPPLCVGYGDYTPVTNEERSFAMFLMLSGGVFFG